MGHIRGSRSTGHEIVRFSRKWYFLRTTYTSSPEVNKIRLLHVEPCDVNRPRQRSTVKARWKFNCVSILW
jgi:hypothetical protein